MSDATYAAAIDAMTRRIDDTAERVATGFPHYADTRTGEWTPSPAGDWTGGFWGGELWLTHHRTGSEAYRRHALRWADLLRPRTASNTVFRGFLFYYGAALGAILGDDATAAEIAVDGARAFASGFQENVGAIPLGSQAEEASDVGDSEFNIDGVPGTALLAWAAQRAGDAQLRDLAIAHARRHIELCVRDDGSVCQSASVDLKSGTMLKRYTHKGFSDDSTWTRAQAWAMVGYALAAYWLPEDEFLSPYLTCRISHPIRYNLQLPPQGGRMTRAADGDLTASGSGRPDRARLTTAVAIASLLVVAGSYVVNAMDRQVFPVVAPLISDDHGFTLAQSGLLATIFTLGIGLAGVPTGYLLDRVSRKLVMLAGIVIYSVFTVLTAVAFGFFDMFAYRALSGVGEAMQNAALFSAVGAYFFANRALALGALNVAYGLGSFLGPYLGANLAAATGFWQTPFYVYGGVGFLFVVVIALFIRKAFTEQVEGKNTASAGRTFNHVPGTLLNRNLLLLAVTAMVAGVAMYGYLGLYPTFLQDELGLTPVQAGTAASMFGIGALVGLPAGWLGDRLNQRYVLIGALLAACVVGYLLFNGPTSAGWQYLLSFCEGALASGFCFVNIYSSMQRAVRPDMIGRASGMFVTSFYVPSALAGYIFAALVEGTGWGGAGFWQLGLFPLVGVAALLFVDVRKFSNYQVEGR